MQPSRLGFEKREIILVLGILLLMIGMISFMAPLYAVAIAIALYFGIRVFVGRRKRQIQNEMGGGVCATCGGKIVNNKCSNCNLT